jgi:hypothetical protein
MFGHGRQLIGCAVLGIAAVIVGFAATTGAASSKPFTVASTLDGKTVLRHRIHWIATTTLPPSQIVHVKFLIDGKVRWIDPGPHFVYGDNEGSHRGYLVTSWLKPGKHSFTAVAVTTDGRTASDAVVARVRPAPAVPKTLAGTWERTVSDTLGAPKPGSAGNPTDSLTPPGTYKLMFERRWVQDVFPCDATPCRFNPKTGAGAELASDWTPGATTFAVRGPVTFRVFHNTDRLGGWWCWMDGPDAKYTWSVSGNTLTLAPIGGHDACGIRGFIWAGKWTRVG